MAAREYTVDALAVLVKGLKSKNERHAKECADLIHCRGWGRPAQEITGRGGGPIEVAVQNTPDLSHLSDEQLKVLHDIPGALGRNGAAPGGSGSTTGGDTGGGSSP